MANPSLVSSLSDVNENTKLVGYVDASGQPTTGISYSIAGVFDYQLFEIDNEGKLNFVTPPDFEGTHGNSYKVTIIATASGGETSSKTYTFNVKDVNEAPVAGADTKTLNDTAGTDAGVTAATGNVLANDTDQDTTHGDSLSVVSAKTGTVSTDPSTALQSGVVVLQGTYGTLTLRGNGSYTYVANAEVDKLTAGESKTDVFTYTVSDAGDPKTPDQSPLETSATLTITVNGTNDRPEFTSAAASASFADTIDNDSFTAATGRLSASDRDTGDTPVFGITGGTASTHSVTAGDSTVTTYDVQKAGTYGTLYLNSASGAYTYEPNDTAIEALKEAAQETFQFTVSDGALSNTQTYTVNLTATNDRPEFTSAAASASFADTIDNDSFTAATGRLSASDRDTGDTPVFGITGGTASTHSVTAGDSTVTTYDVQKAGTYGTLYLNSASGAYTYEPNDTAIEALKEAAQETFQFTVSDGALSNTQTYTVNLTATNDRPEFTSAAASASFADTIDNDSFTVATGRLSASDRDTGDTPVFGITGGTASTHSVTAGDSTVTTYDVQKAGTYGTLYLNSASGAYTYEPNDTAIEALKEAAQETFQFTVSDGALSNTQTYTVNLTATNDRPEFTSAAASASFADTIDNDSFTAATGRLSASDRDTGDTPVFGITGGTASTHSVTAGDSTVTTYDVQKAGTYGTLYLNSASGAYTYEPNDTAIEALKEAAQETFQFTVSDGALSNTQTYTVNLTATNDRPEFTSAAASASFADTIDNDSFTAATGRLSASDRDTGDTPVFGITGGTASTHSVTAGDSTVTTYDVQKAGTYGTLYLNSASGAYTYEPNDTAIEALKEAAQETFQFTVSDGALSNTQTYTVNLTATNDIPTFTSAATFSPNENLTQAGKVVAFDRDANDSLTYSIVETGAGIGADHGFFSIDPSSGVLSFVSPPDFERGHGVVGGSNSYQVTVQVIDASGAAVTQLVTVNVQDTAPNLRDTISATVAENETSVANVNIAGGDTSSVTYGIANNFGNADLFEIDQAGNLSFKAAPDFEHGLGSGTGSNSYSVGVYLVDNTGNVISKTYTFSVTDVNEAPVAVADTATVTDTATINAGTTVLDVAAADGVLKNDTDQDTAHGDSLSVVSAKVGTATSDTFTALQDGTVTLQGTYGTLTLKGDGSYSYVANAEVDKLTAGETKTDVFTYTVSDAGNPNPEAGAKLTATSTLTVTVNGANDTPVLSSAANSIETFAGGVQTGWLLANGGAAPTDTTADDQFSDFLGRFGGSGGAEAVSKTYTLTPSASPTTITFNFNKIDSWDEGYGGAHEAFTIFLNGQTAVVFQPAGFTGNGSPGGNSSAAGRFEAGTLTGSYTITSSGSDSDLGFGNAPGTQFEPAFLDRVYHVTLTLDATPASLKLGFGSNLDQGLADESYGIDNVTIVGLHATSEIANTSDGTGTVSVSTSFTFTDADPTDTHSASVGAPTTTWSGGTIGSLSAVQQEALSTALASAEAVRAVVTEAGGAGSIAVTFSAPDKAFDFLAAGESLTVTYSVRVDDGHQGISTQPVTFTVFGTNDAPVVSGTAGFTASATEAADATGQATVVTASATFSFTDLDRSDTHTIAAPVLKQDSVTWLKADQTSGGTISQELETALANALTVSLAADSTNGATGKVDWSVALQDKQLDFLAVGETLRATYTITVSDEHGGTFQRDVVATFTGSNDRPTLAAVPGATYTDTSAADQFEAKAGTLVTSDADTHHGATFGITGGAADTSRSGFDLSKAVIEGGVTYGTVYLSSGTGEYVFVPSDTAINGLLPDQIKSLSVTFTVNDGSGATNATASAEFAISLTGANDAPTISGTVNHDLVEAGGTANGTAGTATAVATLTKADADGTATYDVAVLTADGSGWTSTDDGATYTKAGTYGTVTLDTAANTLTYVLDNTLEATQALKAGDKPTETFTVPVTDGALQASTAITFTVNGSNDAPTISAVVDHDLVEAGGTANGTTGTAIAVAALTKADIDGTATYDVAVLTAEGSGWTSIDDGATYTKAGIYGTVTLDTAANTLTYALDDTRAATQALKAGDKPTETFTVPVTDGALQASTAVTFTVNGSNDAPTISATEPAHLVEAGGTANGIAGTATAVATLTKADAEGVASYDIAALTANDSGWTSADNGATYTKAATYGTVTLTLASNTLTYTLDNSKVATQRLTADDHKTEAFTIPVKDSNGATAEAVVTFSIDGANDAPVLAQPVQLNYVDTADVDLFQSQAGRLTSTDEDLGGTHSYGFANSIGLVSAATTIGGVTYDVSKAGTYGTLYLESATGKYLFVPNDGAIEGLRSAATETFALKVSDGTTLSDTKTLTIALTGAEDPTVAVADTGRTSEDNALIRNALQGVLANDSDRDANPTLTVTGVRSGTGSSGFTTVSSEGTTVTTSAGALTIKADGSYTFVPGSATQSLQEGDSTIATFTYQVRDTSDPAAQAVMQTLTITIDGANDAAVLDLGGAATSGIDTAVTFIENGGPLALAPSLTLVDVDNATLQRAVVTLTNAKAADLLAVTGTLPGSLSSSINTSESGKIVLTLSGDASVGDYAAALKLVTFQNTSDDPSTETRLVTIVVNDGRVDSLAATASVGVTAVNDPAVISGRVTGAVTEKGGVDNATPGTATAEGTLTATDVDSSSSFTEQTNAATTYGTFSITSAGVWTYTLDDTKASVQALTANQTVTDNVTVTTADGTQKVIAITVTGANDAATIIAKVSGSDIGSVTEDGASQNPVQPQVTSGQVVVADVDSGEAKFQLLTGNALVKDYGSFTFNAETGAWQYTLDNGATKVQALKAGETVTDTLTVTSLDGSASHVITVTIHGTNDAAVIGGDLSKTLTEADTAEALSTSGTLTSLDVDGEANAFIAKTQVGQYGTLSLQADGHYSYTASSAHDALKGGQTYSDSFDVQAADGTLAKVEFTLTGTNDAPALTGEKVVLVAGTEDIAYTVTKAQLLAGFTDVDSETLSVVNLSADHGTVTANEDGSFTVTPTLNYNGPVSLSYGVSDGSLTTSATQSFSLTAVNDAPVLTGTKAVLAAGTEDTAYTVTKAQLLAGFTDVDSPSLSVVNLSADHGTVTANEDGSFTVTPTLNYNGLVSLSYGVSDGSLTTSATQSFSLAAVNDAPALTGEKVVLAAGTEDIAYTVTKAQLLAGFTDVDSETLSVVNLSADHGTVTANEDGSFTVTPTLNYNGVVSLSYGVSDGSLTTSATQSFSLTAVNDAPALTGTKAVLAAGTEDIAYTVTKAQLLAGFTDVDSPSLSVVNLSADHGTVTANSDGSFTVTPTLNYNGPVSLSYGVSDGSLITSATQSFSLAAVNDAPVLTGTKAVLAAGTEDIAYTVTKAQLLAGFTDVDSPSLSVVGLTADHGTVTANSDGSFTVTPTLNYNGVVSLSYGVSDGSLTVPATQSFNLAAVNDAPVLTGTKAVLAAGTEDIAYTVTKAQLLAGFTDVDSPSLSVVGLTADHGTVTANSDGSFTVTPTLNYNGVVSLSYGVSDGSLTVPATQSFSLAAVNDAPTGIAVSNQVAVVENTTAASKVADLTVQDVDAELSFRSYGYTVSDNRFEVRTASDGTAALYLKAGQAVDYEAASTIPVTVTATDTTDASLSTSRLVTVAVTNILDQFAVSAAPSLQDYGLLQGWGSINNPRILTDVDHNGTGDYLAFGYGGVFLSNGITGADGENHNGPAFTKATVLVSDFGTNQGYTAEMQRGAALTGAGTAETIYGQGNAGLYWYEATGSTTHTDAAGKAYTTPTYSDTPHLYADFGTAQGWTEHNGFQILKTGAGDAYASILGFGTFGIVVGEQAFAPGASTATTYTIPLAVGNAAGWDQKIDVRTFQDSKGNTLDFNHDGIVDFLGMGPEGAVFAFGQKDANGHFTLGELRTAAIGADGGTDLGRAQGWTDDATLRMVVHNDVTGYDDIFAFGNAGLYVAQGQDPTAHGGQAFGQLHLAIADFGTDQGWSNSGTQRLVGDVNGDKIADIVGFGFNATYVALGSRDASGKLSFALDPLKTINDFGTAQGWDNTTTVRQLADVDGSGHDSLVLSGYFGTQTWHLV
ncbi:VCBS domain-containing protein [Methylorubrum populi]